MAGRRGRVQQKTCLLVGEGKADKSFLGYLKSLYANKEWRFTIDKAGGDPNSVIIKAKKIGGAYDKVFAVSDADREISVQYAKKNIISLRMTPCLESVLLQACGEAIPKSSADAKKKSKALIAKDAQSLKLADWQRYFPKNALDAVRAKVSELDDLIKVFEDPKSL